jgi:hypothetical protein
LINGRASDEGGAISGLPGHVFWSGMQEKAVLTQGIWGTIAATGPAASVMLKTGMARVVCKLIGLPAISMRNKSLASDALSVKHYLGRAT